MQYCLQELICKIMSPRIPSVLKRKLSIISICPYTPIGTVCLVENLVRKEVTEPHIIASRVVERSMSPAIETVYDEDANELLAFRKYLKNRNTNSHVYGIPR